MSDVLAPIALFVYKRDEHVRATIESLKRCDGFRDSQVYVFADGPKAEKDIEAVRTTRETVRNLLGNAAVYVESSVNLGLARSIVSGVTRLCDEFGRVIVVEDDLILSPFFLRFLNDGLNRFADEDRVMQVSGHMFDVPSISSAGQALFLPFATSWGWATWKRAWTHFDFAATGWQIRLSEPAAAQRFNLDGNYNYKGMLEKQIRGEVDSWAILWYYSMFARFGLSLFPPYTLVLNRGMDRSGSHGRSTRLLSQSLTQRAEWSLPSIVAESPAAHFVYDAIGKSMPRSWRSTLRQLRPSDILDLSNTFAHRVVRATRSGKNQLHDQ